MMYLSILAVSGLNYKRKKWSMLLDEVMVGNIDTIYITSKDRFVRVRYDWFVKTWAKFRMTIIVWYNPDYSHNRN